jgi:hypothetical protein
MKMKKTASTGSLRSSTQADAEFDHIEKAIGQLRAMSQKAAGNLNVDYWRERLTVVSDSHALVPAQKRRVDALRKTLDTLTQPPGDSTQPTGSRGKRTTNRLWAKAA